MSKEAYKRCILTLPSNRMEIKLHFLPEKPKESCKVIIYSALSNGEIFYIVSTDYSAYWDMFYMCDDYDKLSKSTKEANESITAWAYFDEVKEEYKDEVLR